MAARHHIICSASGGAPHDPRVPWIEDDPHIFLSAPDFVEQVWLELDYPHNHNLARVIKSLKSRDVSIAFSHGDPLPKNPIFPGGLDAWYAGWMPIPWDALKAKRHGYHSIPKMAGSR